MAGMSTPLDSFHLWANTLGKQPDSLETIRERLRQSFLSFRGRVAMLVSSVGSELPGLTVHDVTHLDNLWAVAYQIAGENFPLNPAEAYVLGGAFLLHDSAHVLAAYPGGMAEIRQSTQWQDLICQRYGRKDPDAGSLAEKAAIFQVLRHLHAEQAHRLPSMSWGASKDAEPLPLIEDFDLRQYYGNLIGEIASSHHWSSEKVAATFRDRHVSCPSFLAPARWDVDALKVAFLLRTADAAHLDASRAPWFLFALRQPQGVSADHWKFQAKLGQPTRTSNGELRLSSGSTFDQNERAAWWLAFDTARMVDRELRAAHDILKEQGRAIFASVRVQGVDTPDTFSRLVRVSGWEPIDVAPKVGNLPRLISTLGGTALYGDDLSVPLRELIQNGLDAVSAMRSLHALGPEEGSIDITAKRNGKDQWLLAVTDTGIGMSRYVLTEVLLDFGTSLWSSDALLDEHPGLSRTRFKSVGKFGIGFFSVFMLGDEVRVVTRRWQAAPGEKSEHWELKFDRGLSARPALLAPAPSDRLARPGTRIEVLLSDDSFNRLLQGAQVFVEPFVDLFGDIFSKQEVGERTDEQRGNRLAWLVSELCPASDVSLYTRLEEGSRYSSVRANDWFSLDAAVLLERAQSSKSTLYPVLGERGRLIGRVGLSPDKFSGDTACIVHQGMASGRVEGITGLILAASNNEDAGRFYALPAGETSQWQAWANTVIQSETKLTHQQMLALHPLVPTIDLPVWHFGSELMTLAEITERLPKFDEVLVHAGDVTHDDADYVSSHDFVLEPLDVLIRLPEFKTNSRLALRVKGVRGVKNIPAFPWFAGVPPIDYEQRLEGALTEAWGAMEKVDEYSATVGEVTGVEIYRYVSIYQKVDT